MTTPSEVIRRALLLIDEIGASETPSGAQAVDGLAAFNQMLHAWDLDGIHLDHSDLGLTDTIPYPPDHIRPIVYNLAIEIAPEYGAEPSATVIRTADEGKAALRRAYTKPPKLRPDSFWHPYYSPNDGVTE